jgi:hypothetical protein
MRKGSISFVVLFLLLGALGACKSSGSKGDAPAVKAKPANAQAQATKPPPATASHKTSIGKGKASMKTANSPTDEDSYWVAQFDIDGDGTLETTEMLWDDEDKFLLLYSETDVTFDDGGTAVVAMLAGVNGAGNKRGRPAGSGFFAVYLDAKEGGAEVAGLYGCRFDAKGNVSEWAEAVVDSAGDAVVLEGVSE